MFIWKINTNRLDISGYKSVADWINAFFKNTEESTYYFMFDILGIYLTMPLLSLLTKKEHRKTLWLTVLLFFIFNATIPNILAVFKIYWNDSFTVRIAGYAVLAILGYLLSTEDLSKKQRIFIYIGALTGLIYRYLTTFFFSKSVGALVTTTWGYTSWHSMLLASAVFVFIRNLNLNKIDNRDKVTKIIAKIANCSFGIYLIHMIVMFYEKALLNIDTTNILWRTVGVFATYFISLIIVYVIKKIPLVKRIMP